jgi:hypothetical protein
MFSVKRNETISKAIYTYQKVFLLSTPQSAVLAISQLNYKQAQEFTRLADEFRDFILEDIRLGLSYREFYFLDFVRRSDPFGTFFTAFNEDGEVDEYHPFVKMMSEDLIKSAIALEEFHGEWGLTAEQAYKYLYSFRGEDAITVAKGMRDAKKIILGTLDNYANVSEVHSLHADIGYWFDKDISHSKKAENIEKMLDEVITKEYLNNLLVAKTALVDEYFFESSEYESINEVLQKLTPMQVMNLPTFLVQIRLTAFVLLQEPAGLRRPTFRNALIYHLYELDYNDDYNASFSLPLLEQIIREKSKLMSLLLKMPYVIGRDELRTLDPPSLKQNNEQFSKAFNILARGETLALHRFSFQTLPEPMVNQSILKTLTDIAAAAIVAGIAIRAVYLYVIQPLLAPHRRLTRRLFSSDITDAEANPLMAISRNVDVYPLTDAPQQVTQGMKKH